MSPSSPPSPSASDVQQHFSIMAAAREYPNRVGLVHLGREYTFAELAARTSTVIDALGVAAGATDSGLWYADATLDVATVLLVYAVFERGDTLVLLSPGLTSAERRARVSACSGLAPAGRDSGARQARVVIFTSGSRSGGRGVVLRASGFWASALGSAANLSWHDDDRWLACLPLAHVGGLSIVLRCLGARRAAVLDGGHGADGGSFDPAGIAACVRDQRITLMSLVPTMLTRLLDANWSPPSQVRAVLLGGAKATPALLARAADCAVPVLVTYGMSETGSQICTQPYGTAPSLEGRIGPPIPGADVRIHDGRIQVRGPMLFAGYLDHLVAGNAATGSAPATGSDSITTSAPAPSANTDTDWFDTGDCGHLDQAGHLWVLGRADDTIITGGENVHPGEVESVISAYPGVSAVCVFGRDDPVWGQIVVAAVVCRECPAAPELWAQDLAAFLAPRLASARRPRRLALVTALPMNRAGKVDRRQVARGLRDERALIALGYPRRSTKG